MNEARPDCRKPSTGVHSDDGVKIAGGHVRAMAACVCVWREINEVSIIVCAREKWDFQRANGPLNVKYVRGYEVV